MVAVLLSSSTLPAHEASHRSSEVTPDPSIAAIHELWNSLTLDKKKGLLARADGLRVDKQPSSDGSLDPKAIFRIESCIAELREAGSANHFEGVNYRAKIFGFGHFPLRLGSKRSQRSPQRSPNKKHLGTVGRQVLVTS